MANVGRPRVYTNAQRNRILKAIHRTGSKLGAQKDLANSKSPLEVSMAVINSVAKEAKLKFARGRNGGLVTKKSRKAA